MPAVTTEGLILKRRDFGEADRVLTVLTDRYGKISIIAKGVRRITSRRAGNIEVLNRVKLHLFKSKNYNLTEAESIETFRRIKENLTLSTTAFHVIELVDRLIPEEQKNQQIYDITIAALTLLQTNPRQIYIRAFEVKLLSILGFWSPDSIKDLDGPLRQVFRSLQFLSWDQISNLEVSEQQSIALEQVLRYYIQNILESELKSVSVLKKLKA